MRILIAAKRASLRSALKTLIQTHPDIEVVALAKNREELHQSYEATRPDLLLLDEDLNEAFIENVVLPIKESDPKSLIMILGQRPELGEAYLKAGADAYLTKDDSPKSLLTAIEEARLQSKYV